MKIGHNTFEPTPIEKFKKLPLKEKINQLIHHARYIHSKDKDFNERAKITSIELDEIMNELNQCREKKL